MDWTLEVVILPVSDLTSAIEFLPRQGRLHPRPPHHERLHGRRPADSEGSGCSIVIGNLPSQQQMAPGSMHGLQLVVADATAARAELSGAGWSAAR